MDSRLFIHHIHTVKGIIIDVDGVLSPANSLVLNNGEILRTLHQRDLNAMAEALMHSFSIGILMPAGAPGIAQLLTKVGLNIYLLDQQDKQTATERFVLAAKIDASSCMYIGDDWDDISAAKRMGFFLCPEDASGTLKEQSDWVIPVKGGQGVVAYIIEKILRARNKWYF